MITLHHEKETDLTKNGYGSLDDNIVTPVVFWEMNSEFKFSFEYPLFGSNEEITSHLTNRNLVRVPVPYMDDQFFRIYRTKEILGYVRVEARHLFYDLIDNLIEDTNIVGKNGLGALTQLLNATQYTHKFKAFSDIDSTANMRIVRYNPVKALLDDSEDNTYINRWGGELYRDNYNIHMRKRLGSNRGVRIEHKKDLTGFESEIDFSTVITRIMPKGFDGLLLPEKYVDSPLLDPDRPKIRVVEYSEVKAAVGDYADDEDALPLNEAYAELRRLAKEEYSIHHVDEPETVIHVDFVTLENTKEYEDFKELQTIHQGDTVRVLVPEQDIEINSRLVAFKSNPLFKNHYTSTTLGNHVLEYTTSRTEIDVIRKEIKNTNELITITRQAANGKNSNFWGTVDPNTLELNAQIDDTYFHEDGDYFAIWEYVDVNGEKYWRKGPNTDFGKEIANQLKEAVEDIAEAKQTADEAVEQINAAVANAGFTSLDETISSVQTISNQARINSGTAIDNALEAMQQASQAVDNTGSLNVRVDEVENTLSVKADKQMVDDLTGVVDSQALDIQANAQGLALKANQSTVDTLAGTVQSLGTNFDIVAGQVNSRVWNTDIDAKISHIETEWTQTFDTFSQTVAGIDGRVTQQKQTIDAISSTVSGHGNRISTVEQTASGLQSTVAGKASQTQVTQLANGLSSIVRNNDNLVSNPYFHGGDTTGWTAGFVSNADKDNPTREYYMTSDRRDIYNNVEFAVEGGEILHLSVNAWRAWVSPSTEFGIGLRFFDERMTHITWVIGATKHSVENETIKGQLLVPSGARFAHVWIYQNAFSGFTDWFFTDVRVSRTPSYSEFNSQITQLANNINLRVTKGELLSQINIEAGRTLIQSDRLLLNATNTVITGTAWMDGAVIANASIDGAKIADATIGSAKIASLDVSKISGNTSNFVSTAWNTAAGGSVRINGSGILTDNPDGSQIGIAGGRVWIRNTAGNNLGQFGYINDPDSPLTHYVRIRTSLGTNFAISQVYGNSYTFKDTLHLSINSSNQATMNMQARILMNYEGIYFADTADQTSGSIRRVDNTLRIIGPQGGTSSSVAIYGHTGGNDFRTGYTLNTYYDGSATNNFWADLNMRQHAITNQSDERLKTEIVKDEIDSLAAIKNWKMAGFYWKDSEHTNERQFGVIAQSAPEIAYQDRDGYLYVNSSKQLQIVAHGLQQLAFNQDGTHTLAKANETKIHQLQQELSKANRRIEELESA